ncbi:Histone deacetylase [Handroanthus impetiginosus]|uniref:Histone deacetylase n=1 Tax=Handroanthus impetiginosus TaxID=429701 RepID=A0A2G9HM67_9LAMI|nr:Histone deacetylase [Handroanthus impetiginosus]
MEFWGVEVKPGEPLEVTPAFGKLIHISQAALGEVKDVEGAKYVPLRLKVGSKDFIIGSLSAEDRTQVMFDLVFEKKFELSHDWKDGSVYFIGYIADDPVSDDEGFPYEFGDALEEEDESEEEEEPVKKAVENGKIKPKSGDVKAAKAAAAAAAAAKKEEESDSDEDDDDDSDPSSDEELALLNEDSIDVSGDDSEDDEDESSSDEELPKNVKQSKKRPAESAQETPVPAKKAKAATPDKTGNKKGHTGTPFPSKGAGKGPGGNKLQGQTPKSAGHSKPFSNNKAQKSNGKGKRGGK